MRKKKSSGQVPAIGLGFYSHSLPKWELGGKKVDMLEPYVLMRILTLELEIKYDLDVEHTRYWIETLYEIREGVKPTKEINLIGWFFDTYRYDATNRRWLLRLH